MLTDPSSLVICKEHVENSRYHNLGLGARLDNNFFSLLDQKVISNKQTTTLKTKESVNVV